MIESNKKPSVIVRPIEKSLDGHQQPQIIVIPQSMFSNSNLKSFLNVANGRNLQNHPVLTKIVRPSVPILQKPVENTLKRHSETSEDESRATGDEIGAPARKRTNLDHLSLEEKMMRRKLKNRVAAQNARDKKRMKMEEMEIAIKRLVQEKNELQRKNQELQALNDRLTAENKSLKTSNCLETFTSIKDEEFILNSPASLSPPPSSPTPPLSDEDDDMAKLPAVSFEAIEASPAVTVFSSGREATSDGCCSPVLNRPLEPAEPGNVLRQQEQSRSWAVEQGPSSKSATSPEQLAVLLWMCLIAPLATTSSTFSATTTPTSPTALTLETSSTVINSLPIKKRNHWWGSHQASPHPKT